MAAPSEYNIEVESILGGLESALARGQPLKKAMSSFRNAGYKEENIEEAVKKFQVLHQKKFHELATAVPNSQKKIVGAVQGTSEGAVQNAIHKGKEKEDEGKKETQKPKTLVTAQTREKLMEQYEREKLEMESKKPHFSRKMQERNMGISNQNPEDRMDQELASEEAMLEKTVGEAPVSSEDKFPMKKGKRTRKLGKERKESISQKSSKKQQVVSGYGGDAVTASENFKAAIDEMVKSLSKLSVPTPIAQQQGMGKKQRPQVVNKISNYGVKPPTPVNKAVTFLLIFLLILLLGVLAAVFFFREELIELFNTITLEYILPLLLGK